MSHRRSLVGIVVVVAVALGASGTAFAVASPALVPRGHHKRTKWPSKGKTVCKYLSEADLAGVMGVPPGAGQPTNANPSGTVHAQCAWGPKHGQGSVVLTGFNWKGSQPGDKWPAECGSDSVKPVKGIGTYAYWCKPKGGYPGFQVQLGKVVFDILTTFPKASEGALETAARHVLKEVKS